MSTLTTTCPAEIARIGRQALHKEWWDDPVYQAIAAKRIEGETCHYCGQRPATLPHHDEDWHYFSKEAYYDPQNMTPCCGTCHRMYRKGLVICPVCRKHYVLRSSEKCRWCRGLMQVSRKTGRVYPKSTTYRRRHPCGKNLGQQKCRQKIVCSYPPRKAEGCHWFVAREKEVS
jgi:hypothetical protein